MSGQRGNSKKRRSSAVEMTDLELTLPNQHNEDERIPPEEYNLYKCGCYRCCCGPFVHQSCGYPPRTIRAILAFIVALPVLSVTGFAVVYFILNDQKDAALGIIATLAGLLGVVTTSYFAAHSSNSNNTTAKPQTQSV